MAMIRKARTKKVARARIRERLTLPAPAKVPAATARRTAAMNARVENLMIEGLHKV